MESCIADGKTREFPRGSIFIIAQRDQCLDDFVLFELRVEPITVLAQIAEQIAGTRSHDRVRVVQQWRHSFDQTSLREGIMLCCGGGSARELRYDDQSAGENGAWVIGGMQKPALN